MINLSDRNTVNLCYKGLTAIGSFCMTLLKIKQIMFIEHFICEQWHQKLFYTNFRFLFKQLWNYHKLKELILIRVKSSGQNQIIKTNFTWEQPIGTPTCKDWSKFLIIWLWTWQLGVPWHAVPRTLGCKLVKYKSNRAIYYKIPIQEQDQRPVTLTLISSL